MKISEVSWRKFSDGKWFFNSYCDEVDRIPLKGLRVVVSIGRRIDGFIKKGKEKYAKKALLEHRINFLKKEAANIQEEIKEFETLILGLDKL